MSISDEEWVARFPDTAAASRAAASDPFRRRLGCGGMEPMLPERVDPENIFGGPGYAAWASRYAYEYGGTERLRDAAGERQVPNAKTAFLTPGGLFFNAQGLVLRTD